MKKETLKFLLLFLLPYVFVTSVLAQEKGDTSQRKTKDSTKINFVTKMQAFAKKSAKESAAEFATDKAVIEQRNTFEELKKTMHVAALT
ncbi:hypothetical protein [Pedobacter sp. NJ-S-72]